MLLPPQLWLTAGVPSGASCNRAVEGDLHPVGVQHRDQRLLQPRAVQSRAGMSPQGPSLTVGSGGVAGAGGPGTSRCPVPGIPCSVVAGGRDGHTLLRWSDKL